MNGLGLVLLASVVLAGALEVGARALQFASLLGDWAWGRGAARVPRRRPVREEAFVSVHVPTHDEPAALVIATLRALAQSRGEAFEVLVIDNNTPDPETWRPVRAACEALGERFRFLHVDGLTGAKAGALNLALAHADTRATHVAVVDADYQVKPDFLTEALDALHRDGLDYAQCPQAYRGVTASALGVEHELGDYFACFRGGAGRAGLMLPTGTLSLFDIDALRAVGGWPTRTITEDAEIGVRLQRAGYRGLWLAQEGGRGLLPVNFRGLQVQRARWAAGNLQVLRDLCRRRWPGLTPGAFLTLAVQLTAWLSLWLPLAAAVALAALAPALPHAGASGAVAAAAMLMSAALTAARMVFSAAGRRMGWRARLGAVAVKTALAWTSATAWLPALWPRPLRFRRTRKRLGPAEGGLASLAALSLGFLLLVGLYLERGQALQAAACALLAAVWPCAWRVDDGLRAAARANPEFEAA